jgi:hypothetical protein
MELERKQRRLTKDINFLRLLENQGTMQSQSRGGVLRIFDPFKLDGSIQILRSSDEIQKYKEKNEELLQEYQKEINTLLSEKNRLKNKIF